MDNKIYEEMDIEDEVTMINTIGDNCKINGSASSSLETSEKGHSDSIEEKH